MNIIERTQYSADGGETWKETRELAAADGVRSSLAVAVSRYDKSSCWNVASDVMRLCTHNPDALIQAMRDMGALPESSQSDALAKAAKDGEFYVYDTRYLVLSDKRVNGAPGVSHVRRMAQQEYIRRGELQDDDGKRYAVIPVEQYAKEEAALARVIEYAKAGFASACDWCDAHGINWKDN